VRLNLPTRIFIPFLFLFFVFLSIINYHLKPILVSNVAKQLTSDAVILSQSIADYTTMSLNERCSSRLLTELSQAQSSKHNAQITLFIPNCGQTDLAEINLNEFVNQPHLQLALQGETYSNYQVMTNQVRIQTFVPIFYKNSIIGAISYEKVEDKILNEINQDFIRFNLVFTIITVVVSICSLIITNSYFQSIKQINQELQNLFNQPGDSKLFHRTDEIGILYKSLVNAIQKLKVQLQQISSMRESLSNVIENMKDGIVIVNENGQVVLTNRAAKEMFSVKINKKNATIMEAFRNHNLDEVWSKCHNSQETQFISIENPNRNLFIECIATPLQSDSTNSTLLLLQDVTKLRQLENIRRTFVSNVSHELRTPLASIKAIIETLQEGAIKDTRARDKFLQLMSSEIDHLSHMVQELVELSRIESGQFPLKKQPVNPENLILTSIDRMKLQAERGGLTITHSVEHNLPNIYVDVPRIEQVLMNLIHNAIKFTEAGGNIHIHARREKNEIIFSIKDTGIGIPPGDLERVFERFYKVDKSRSEQGTGLGLSIARHVINAHSGRIWVESVLTQGSTFYFTIPI